MSSTAKTIDLKGLSNLEAAKRLTKYGENEIKMKSEFSTLKIFLSQFTSFLVLILVCAGAISISLGELTDGLAIMAIVIVNSIIGFLQEYKAENAVKALKKLVIATCIVIRDNIKKEIAINKLVPGDLIILSEGDKIPADLQIIESFSLQVDEAILTGESLPVNKKINDSAFKGTLITTGRGIGIVQATGANTEFGKIVNLLSENTKTKSPLTVQLDQLGKKLGLIVTILVAILFILGSIREISTLEMLMTSVSLGVSAIPEGMPIIITLTLAIGVQALAKKKAIIRKMNAVETLGATTVICSDKTGTLTLNEMTVTKINTGFQERTIPGLGYKIEHEIKLTTPEEKKLLEICENCNNSTVSKNILGDPTEIALKILARKAKQTNTFETLDEIVFSSERKMMSTLHQIGKTKEVFAKGAYEEILKRCKEISINGKIRKITANDRKKIEETAEKYSAEALRVLAFAYKPYQNKFDEENLIFVGLIGMIDPPHKSVKESIKIAHSAGIKIKIITGDNPITAKAIGEKIGLKISNVTTGQEIDEASDEELAKIIEKTEIFARTKPEHKYRIVDILKKRGEIVAVTGDGVNDAPAIKHSDVGIAMGIKGTEATKEVADIILKDDNFSTIVEAVKEGRRTYQNLLSFIKFMLSANFITLILVGIITLLGYPLPMLALQILWINLATDALPALALGNSPGNSNLMLQKPREKNENVLKKFMNFILVAMIIQVIVNMIIYFYGLQVDQLTDIATANLEIPSHTRTLIFTQTVMFELLLAFVCKEEKDITLKSLTSNKYLIGAVLISFLLQISVVYLPFMQNIFKTVPLDITEWLIIIAGASTAFLVPKFIKKT